MTGKYKSYPEYKDSGVEWIGKIPSDWDMWKIAHACPYIASGTTPKSDDNNYYDGENLWVTTSELREGIILDTQKKVTTKALIDIPTLRLHPEGSVAIAMYGATIGRLGIFGKEATTNQACCVMPPSTILHNKFLFYWLYATRQEITNLSSGGGQPNVNQEKIASLKVSAPDYKLQAKIANFLDYETAKIDTLIEIQQQLIQLLKEKRQAVISHAVTKGFNPNTKMRESGIQWLGEVPEHWSIGKIKNLSSTISKGTTPSTMGSDFENTGIRFLKAENIGKGFYVAPQPEFYISEKTDEQLIRSRLQSKDVLVIIAGATTGLSSVITADLLPANTNQAVSFIRPLNKAYSEYISYWLSTEYAKSNIWQVAVQAAQPNLSMESLGNIYIPIPPQNEVESLVIEINVKLLQLASQSENAELAINLMCERRAALISSAVTGKIDLRRWIAPIEIEANKEDAA